MYVYLLFTVILLKHDCGQSELCVINCGQYFEK